MRRKRGRALYSFEVDGDLFELLFRFAGLGEHEAHDREAVARSLRVLFNAAISALRREVARGSKFCGDASRAAPSSRGMFGTILNGWLPYVAQDAHF